MSEKIKFASVRPTRTMNLLSHREIESLMDSHPEIQSLYRECALAILNAGSEDDDPELLLNSFKDFSIALMPQSRGVKLEIKNAPATAFVDGLMIRGIQNQLFDALRDIVFTHNKMAVDGRFELDTTEGISDAVFRILRNAGVVKPERVPNLIICWGGHSIDRVEYDYSKKVGYQMGLRGLDVGTGCGIGAMKGPMKGAAVGHAKQQINNGRYIGITEPGIIASESPNPIVNELVILPDIEKRLEAFVRMSHCIIVFPGGAGTAEEVMYLLGILMHPDNAAIEVPLIFAAPEEKPGYFTELDKFIRFTLGDDAAKYYDIITGNPEAVARLAKQGVEKVKRQRRKAHESYVYNWQLTIPESLQQPFIPSHKNMLALQLNKSVPAYQLVAEMRSAFSGIVAGNVKPFGIEQIRQQGPYQLKGDPEIMTAMDKLLQGFVADGRMKLKGEYKPCYQLN